MAAPKYLDIVSGVRTQKQAIATSAGAGDADKIIATGSDGLLDASFLPNGIGAETITLPATENLAAGDFVNIYDNAGTVSCRKADASGGVAKKADGFVLAAVTSGSNATIYYGNRNTQLSSLTKGSIYYLSGATPGAATTTPPSTSAYIVQQLGKAYSTTAMLCEIEDPVVLA
jgi:hypothetical protein